MGLSIKITGDYVYQNEGSIKSTDQCNDDNICLLLGCHHSSMDSSVLPISLPRFESKAHHQSFLVKFVVYLSCEKNENKEKEVGFGHF